MLYRLTVSSYIYQYFISLIVFPLLSFVLGLSTILVGGDVISFHDSMMHSF